MSRNDRWKCRWLVGLASLVILGVGMAKGVEAQVYLIDTGPGGSIGGRTLSKNQLLAGQFSLDVGHEIYALEGWIIYPTIQGSLPVEAVLYADDGGVPDLADEVYRQLFFVPASGIPFEANWEGADGFALPVYGGTYWLAFEVPTDTSGSGAMPPTPLQELDLYAIDSGAGWVVNETAQIGIRVLPEPGLGAMLLCAIAPLAVACRRRRARDERIL